ncbi:MAG: Fur family transcriptional regulator [Candidatus Nanopelagicales bacterium]
MSSSSKLKAAGLRVTQQRELVLAALDAIRHGTPDEILAEVTKKAAGVNLSTIYRCLEVLEKADLVTHTHLGHGAPTYHVLDGSPHIHLRCSSCERIFSIPAELAQATIDRIKVEHGFIVDPYHITFEGNCEACAKAAK